jgi:RNA polymerase sigma-70 factor (ECF subfamily)
MMLPASRRFDTTHWSVVTAAAGDDSKAAGALAAICETYWYPLYAYVRRSGRRPEDAAELTQEFFARLLERHDLRAVRRERGRFRSYLLGALKHFLADDADRRSRQKRGGGHRPVAIDSLAAEATYVRQLADHRTPETAFERSWALETLRQVLARLAAECRATGRRAQFDVLKPALLGRPAEGYAALGLSLGLSEGATRVAVHRLRARLRDLLRDTVGDTVLTPAAIEEEMAHLLSVIREA